MCIYIFHHSSWPCEMHVLCFFSFRFAMMKAVFGYPGGLGGRFGLFSDVVLA